MKDYQINSDTTFNRLRRWMNNTEDFALQPKEKEQFERIKFAYDSLQIENKSAVVNRLMRVYKIGRSQAYKDIEMSMKLLNPINRNDKEFMRIWTVNEIRKDIMTADKLQDIDKKMKLKERLYERLIKALGLDKEDENKIDPEMLGGNTFIISIQAGNKSKEFDIDKINSYSLENREEFIEEIYSEIDDDEAKELLTKKE